MTTGATRAEAEAAIAGPVEDALCAGCFTACHGYEPEMGDQETYFAPGTCSACGADQILFHLSEE